MDKLEFLDIEEANIETIRKWRNSPEVSKYMYTDAFISTEDQINWYRKIKNDKNSRHWLIQYEGKSVGVVSITDIKHQLSNCYWGFYLGDTNFRSRGIAKKILFKVCEYVFEELQFNKLMAQIFKFNERVIYIHESFGFRREAYYRSHCLKNEKYEDVIGLALLKKEWVVLKDGFLQE